MYKNAFTLIELLVVIAVIGFLASIVLVSLSPARAKARDARRVSDLHNIQLALEMYYDSNGTYKVAGTGSSGNGIGWAAYEGATTLRPLQEDFKRQDF
jgi:prepilin-type N-terminal cleavage/methylation domain-containing protein